MITFPYFSKLWTRTQMARWQHGVGRVERLAPRFATISESDLRKASLSLKYQAASGVRLENLLSEAYALMREAAGRRLGMQHYPVQILGGIALHHGAVAVMQTGEGKTLTATLPLFLAALEGRGAHLVTANDYLAARDAELMRPAYELLGMSVGVVTAESSPEQRARAYACDITYSTAKEIGFDFLRDRLAQRQTQDPFTGVPESRAPTQAQREFHFALVDEADSILIDEARTPLIVSSVPTHQENAQAPLYRWAFQLTGELHSDLHFEHDPQRRQVALTAEGRRLVRRSRLPTSVAATPMRDLYDFVERALVVEQHYQRQRHYVVADREVQIVDEFTGRIADGRKWRSGLHQAIEAREGLPVSQETGEAARITIQDLFLRYQRLAGMTGTVANSGPELSRIYRLLPVQIPTNRPPRRKQLTARVFATAQAKWEAIADEIAEVHQSGRPILVGTRSIDLSQTLSEKLNQRGIRHTVLNANHVEREAQIVGVAGQVGKVTVATNMAGRGTDIQLSDEACKLGGLHVICSELHESARIDRQLIGRCGRQGDPGSYRHFYSLEDDILASGFDHQYREQLQKRSRHTAAEQNNISVFHQAQRRVERHHFILRRQLLFHENQRQLLQREMGQDPYLDTIE